MQPLSDMISLLFRSFCGDRGASRTDEIPQAWSKYLEFLIALAVYGGAAKQREMARDDALRSVCPVAKAAEIVAERWTPLVVHELLAGSNRFNDIRRGVPLMSQTLLSERLKELERVGIVERRGDGKLHT